MPSVEDSLNEALQTLVDDLKANRLSALSTFEAWCHEHSEDIQLMELVKLLQSQTEELSPEEGD